VIPQGLRLSTLRRMVDPVADERHRSFGVRVLALTAFVLVSAGCTKADSAPVQVADDFAGTGSLAFVEANSTVHCFPIKAGGTYSFTGVLRNATGSSVQVEPVPDSGFTMKFADQSSEDTDATTYIAPHGTVPFQITFVNKANTSEYAITGFAPAVTMDGHRTVDKLTFPYQVRFESIGSAKQACTPRS
jgi:hypothetical protein